MDDIWSAAASFICGQSLQGRTLLAPSEFSETMSIGYSYRNAVDDPNRIDTVILHKGKFKEIDAQALYVFLVNLAPVFANEVFIILSRTGDPLDADNPHLAALADAADWCDAARHSPQQVMDLGGKPVRMPATYLGANRVLAETIHGHLVTLPSDDRGITPHIIRDGYFDLGMTRFIERQVRPGQIFVDVGANIGLYTLAAAVAVGQHGRVIAIEPMEHLRPLIYDNLSMNGLTDRVTLVQCAVGDRQGEATVKIFPRYLGSSTLSSGVAEREASISGETPVTQTVAVRTLPDILAELQVSRPDLIKIDVEGFELEVMRGARSLFEDGNLPEILMEWHPAFRSEGGSEALLDLLIEDLGMSLRRLLPDGTTGAIDRGSLSGLDHADLWAVRAE